MAVELSAEQKKAIEAQKEQCPFCQIVAGKIPATKVFEDNEIIAILDINPARPGHLLVLPKEHYPIMPLIPPKSFEHLFSRIQEISKHLRKAMLSSNASIFIANGPAAGQQSSHFLVHIIPSDKPLSNFSLKKKPLPEKDFSTASEMLKHNLPLMLKNHSGKYPLAQEAPAVTDHPEADQSGLAQMIADHPELRQMIMEKPEAVRAGLEDNPSLKPLFEGVDIEALGRRLRQQEEQAPLDDSVAEIDEGESAPPEKMEERPPDVPKATDLSDVQLAAFINGNERLKELLLHDAEALEQAVIDQPRLQRFFLGSSVPQVRARFLEANTPRPATERSEEERRW